jgi:uncharacterized protein YdhG (YjbR/CyaY superfamily)
MSARRLVTRLTLRQLTTRSFFMAKTNFKTADEYIASFSETDQVALQAIRKAIRDAVPDAEETISYQIPAFRTGDGWIFYYSVYTNHLSLASPPPWTEREVFKAELKPYKLSKSAIQFPKTAPLPLKLIGEMAAFRARHAAEQTNVKTKG